MFVNPSFSVCFGTFHVEDGTVRGFQACEDGNNDGWSFCGSDAFRTLKLQACWQ